MKWINIKLKEMEYLWIFYMPKDLEPVTSIMAIIYGRFSICESKFSETVWNVTFVPIFSALTLYTLTWPDGPARLKSCGLNWRAPIPVLTNRKHLPIVDKRCSLGQPRQSNRREKKRKKKKRKKKYTHTLTHKQIHWKPIPSTVMSNMSHIKFYKNLPSFWRAFKVIEPSWSVAIFFLRDHRLSCTDFIKFWSWNLLCTWSEWEVVPYLKWSCPIRSPVAVHGGECYKLILLSICMPMLGICGNLRDRGWALHPPPKMFPNSLKNSF